MSIVDKLIARHEAETKALIDGHHAGVGVREHAVRQISEMIALARELYRHCEAMNNSFDRRVKPESARAYEKFKQERTR